VRDELRRWIEMRLGVEARVVEIDEG